MTMTQTRTDAGQLLRFALKFDAVVSGLNGIAYLAGAGLLAGELGLPVTLLVSLGVVLLVWRAAAHRHPAPAQPARGARRGGAERGVGGGQRRAARVRRGPGDAGR